METGKKKRGCYVCTGNDTELLCKPCQRSYNRNCKTSDGSFKSMLQWALKRSKNKAPWKKKKKVKVVADSPPRIGWTCSECGLPSYMGEPTADAWCINCGAQIDEWSLESIMDTRKFYGQ